MLFPRGGFGAILTICTVCSHQIEEQDVQDRHWYKDPDAEFKDERPVLLIKTKPGWQVENWEKVLLRDDVAGFCDFPLLTG